MAYQEDTTTFMLKSLASHSKGTAVQTAPKAEQNENDNALVESPTEAPTCDMSHVLSQCLSSTSKKEETPS